MRFDIKEHAAIQGWRILHLKKRKDRYALSLSNAERLGVPRNCVHFWDAIDADDFQDTEAIIEAAVADGFSAFSYVHVPSVSYPGRLCQTWNVCRFLRDLADRDSVECLIHDGMLIAFMRMAPYSFFPDFRFLSDCVAKCQALDDPFQMLTVGDIHAQVDLRPIEGGSMILKGVLHESNSVRIYSSLGARNILKRIEHRLRRGVHEADIMFREDEASDDGGFSSFWSLPGMYTLLCQSIAMDMPPEYLGSNTVDWESLTGVYAEVFRRWRT